ncbi:MAG: hypothetical protein KME07_07085 [Pegethrix bostrychoides GSE-TBD4-15B]|uniref:Uncharacterized protein n=1 Tax=Pegethrix bostrychoides GSE-TBD4-15B TaxID=2839662 RepID=A0A951P9F7_9CYAN|nr:hypothetical protein [Pegethrix bostrychoides GSE-TBD4-15B]
MRERLRQFRRAKAEPTQLQQIQADLLTESLPDLTYLILIIGSCAIATFGLLANSTAVIIRLNL